VQIFINYRVEDTGGYAWAVYFRLARRFGAENVFFDKMTLRPGAEWLDEINQRTSEASVFLALVGPSWADTIVQHMKAAKADYVVKEISRALRSRPRVSVIPVLVRTNAPGSRRLPPALRPLFDLQWARVEHETLNADIDRLVERLDEIAASTAATPPHESPTEPAVAPEPS
jgi:hypothetical protein